jgi:hypothetical protein
VAALFLEAVRRSQHLAPGAQPPTWRLASFTAAQVRDRITSLTIFWSKTNSQFRAAVGKNPSPDWPVGSEASLGEDLVEQFASRPGAAGYVELNFAALDSLQKRDVDSACVERTLLSAAFDPDFALILLTPAS